MPKVETKPHSADGVFDTSFVGRESELDELRGGLNRILGGRGQFFCIAGEPGIGKTRLAQEIAAAAEQAGASVAWGRCWEGGGAPAYWPWIQIVRTLLPTFVAETSNGSIPSSVLTALYWLTGEASADESHDSRAAGLPALPSKGIGLAEPARFRLFDSVDIFLKRLSATKPLAIILDDIHCADRDTLLLLRFIAREQLQSKVLVLATLRDSERHSSPEQNEMLNAIRREGRVIQLGGLKQPEVTAFVERSPAATLDHRLFARLYEVCEGNPFYLDETLRLLNADGPQTRPALARLAIPDSVHEVIRRRIAPLPEDVRALLEIAAIIGREFNSELLAHVAGLAPADCLAKLADATRSGILQSISSGDYRFGHAMIRETLIDDLPDLRRIALHRAVAEQLEELHQQDLSGCLAELAEHHVHSLPLGSRPKAIEFSRRSAQRATEQFAYAEAVRLYEMALAAMGSPADLRPEPACELSIEYGGALTRSGNLDRAREVLLRAAELARQSKRIDLLAKAALALGANSATVTTFDQTLATLLEEALAALPEADDSTRVMLLARLGAALGWSRLRDRSEQLCEDAVTTARRLGDPLCLIYALAMWHYSRWSPDNLDQRLDVANEIVELSRRLKVREWERRALERQLADLCEKGQMREAEVVAASYRTLSDQLGFHDGSAELAAAMRALLKGEFTEAERLAEEALALGQRVQEPRALLSYAAQIAAIRFEQGRLGELEPILRAYVQEFPALDVARCGLALACIQTGREAAARLEFEYLARENFAVLKRDWNWLATMAVAAEVCVYLRDLDRAASIYQLMLPYADRNITLGWYEVSYGSASRYLAKLATLTGRFEDAQRHFEKQSKRKPHWAQRPC